MAPNSKSAREVLAANLRRLRLARELSQERLAERAGIHRNYLGGIERRERNVGLDNVESIARALGVTVSELLTESSES
jgi:transcriptional regulator with XRE-family HTH domain